MLERSSSRHLPYRRRRPYLTAAVLALISLLGAAALAPVATAAAPADSAAKTGLYVPPEEFVSYMDANNMYTIIGNVKNWYDRPVAPILTLSVRDGPDLHEQIVRHATIPAHSELPFKVKMPGVSADAVLLEPAVRPARALGAAPPDIRVIYDETLIVHPDGHLTGYVTNAGGRPAEDPVVWAVVHGAGGPLDVARSSAPLGLLAPGETVAFEMHPDPAVLDAVTYYSCFAPSDDSTVPIKADRNGQTYEFRYDSGAWLYRPVFSEDGTEITFYSTNSFPFETFANLEIPPVTRQETFSVHLDGVEIDSIQSVDEMGMWHLAFNIPEHSQPLITIRGFEAGQPLSPMVPPYVREDAALWADGAISDDELLETLRLLAFRSMMPAGPEGDPLLPDWLAPLMGWYGEGLLDDGQFLAATSYMLDNGVMRLG